MDANHVDVRARIESACRRLEEQIDQEPSLDELARGAALSPFHFHRLFRGLVGETVAGYSRRLRLERAAHRLKNTEGEILGIALDSGYGSHEAFTRAFKRHFGRTPQDYRHGETPSTQRAASPMTNPIDLRIEEREACTVACVRHVGPYSEVGDAWKTLMKWGWKRMIFGSPRTFGLCYDDPEVTASEKVRYDACMVVPPGTRTKGEVRLESLPGGTFAVATHLGDYAALGDTYADLFAAIVTRGAGNRPLVLGDPPSMEVYLNDPRKTPPRDLRTEIWMPVHSHRTSVR